jgi:hypothetical protein
LTSPREGAIAATPPCALSLKPKLSYPGWQQDVAEVEAVHRRRGDSFTSVNNAVGNMQREQQVHRGDRSHPVTRALDALTPTLTYPGWQADTKQVEQCTYPGWQTDTKQVEQCTGLDLVNDGDSKWMEDLGKICEKQRTHEGDRSHPTLRALVAHIKRLAAMMA